MPAARDFNRDPKFVVAVIRNPVACRGLLRPGLNGDPVYCTAAQWEQATVYYAQAKLATDSYSGLLWLGGMLADVKASPDDIPRLAEQWQVEPIDGELAFWLRADRQPEMELITFIAKCGLVAIGGQ